MDSKLLYLWLNSINGIGPIIAKKLLEHFKDVENIYRADIYDLVKVDGIGVKLADKINKNRNLDKFKRVLEKCINDNIEIITREHKNYPEILKGQDKAPMILFVKGKIKQFNEAVAIVGARRCSEYGKKITVELAEELSKYNIPIISGMAKGIDSYAHTIALRNNNYTIAVLGTGVDKCYPSEHINLMNSIIESGAVISQFAPNTKCIRENFIKRNELIAMLSSKIVVVEASNESGAIHTGKFGLRNNKEVFAVPNDIYNKLSIGTNKLIENGAKIYLSSNSIIDNSGLCLSSNNIEAMTDIEKYILNILRVRSLSIDQLCKSCNIDLKKLQELIMSMELKGLITQSCGRIAIEMPL